MWKNRCEDERSVLSEVGTARSRLLRTDSKEERPEKFEGRMLFVSTFNDVEAKKIQKNVFRISQGKGLRLGLPPSKRRKHMIWNAQVQTWRKVAWHTDVVVEKFHAKWTSEFPSLKKKGGRCTIHVNAESSNAELFFRTIHSANQVSIGAVASWCEELALLTPGQTHWSTEKSLRKRTSCVKVGTTRSGLLSAHTNEE